MNQIAFTGISPVEIHSEYDTLLCTTTRMQKIPEVIKITKFSLNGNGAT
jgi:hypothetical protein